MTLLLHQLAARSAERMPDVPAVVLGGVHMTYQELVTGSRQLGRYLSSECSIRRGDRVAVVASKSPAAVRGLHAVLEAGGAYVPVDPTSPAPRAARILTAAAPRAVLVDASAAPLLAHLETAGCLEGVAVVQVDPDSPLETGVEARTDDWRTLPAGPVNSRGHADDLAHVLFTSGSTGAPKGVQITHRSVLAFLDWALPHFGIATDDRISGHPPLHFDLSTFDIYGSMAAGAQLHLVSAGANLHPAALASFIRDSGLTQWFSVPSTLAYLVRADVISEGDLPRLRRILFCGEPMPMPVLRRLMQRLPHVRFTNLYGPTEATIASTYYDVPDLPPDDRSPVPIGVPCTGEQAIVVGDDGQLLPHGQTGHLCLAGAGLSPGYWRAEDETAAAFGALPALPGQRVYRTGDLARVDEQGLLQFIGRRDTQVKHRGYRIELGEVEVALAALEGIAEVAVVTVPTSSFAGNELCCAYVPTEPEQPFTELRNALARVLPAYMVPTRWRPCEVLPKNQNGKIDRRAIQREFATAMAAPTHG